MSKHLHPDYGTGEKRLSIYIWGMIICSLLTLFAFWMAGSGHFSRTFTFVCIYLAACVQFIVQLLCFLRLNIQSEQGQINVMSILFTIVILMSIVIGSLWIMWNLDYNMVH